MDEFTRTPLARSKGLVVEELGDELLVYDLETHRAHSLSPEAARVWRRCDGRTPVDGLSAQLGLDADTVERALEELEKSALLDPETQALPGTTRRQLTVRMAKVGTAVAAAPLILSITAPAAHAVMTPPTPEFCAQGQGTTGCGAACKAFHCCCCCMGTGIVPPTGNQLCFPTAMCEGVTGRNCSDKAPCP
jgi:Coenzyme PQQ synthesis protein D (PqqD)